MINGVGSEVRKYRLHVRRRRYFLRTSRDAGGSRGADIASEAVTAMRSLNLSLHRFRHQRPDLPPLARSRSFRYIPFQEAIMPAPWSSVDASGSVHVLSGSPAARAAQLRAPTYLVGMAAA